MDKQTFIVQLAEGGERQDVYLTAKLPDYTRSRVMKLLESGSIVSNHGQLKAGYRVRPGDTYLYTPRMAVAPELAAEAIPLTIVYQDESLLVIDKPVGMVVHPAAGNQNGTLVNALLAAVDNLSGINGVARPGIVHRIDKDTSGLLVVAKNDIAHLALSRQIADKTAQRRYLALVHDNLRQDSGIVDAPIGRSNRDRKKMAVRDDGRAAVTHWRVLERYIKYTYLEASLETGRTHQIRVHMASIGHPVVGDMKYGPAKNEFKLTRQFLHAYYLEFAHPVTGEQMSFTTPLPDDLAAIRDKLMKRSGRD